MPALSEEELASRYGWSMAVLNSSPDLKNLFSQAVAGTWTADKFTAELRNTNWFKQNGETARQAAVLKQTDPATWGQRVAAQSANVLAAMVQQGAILSPTGLQQMAENVVTFGWNENQLKQAMRQYVVYAHGQLHGQAATSENEIRKYAASMGVRIGDGQVTSWAADVASGMLTMETPMGAIQNYAESAFPHLAERFRNGETYDSVAQPYKQSMAQLLEMSPEAIDNFDPTVRGALAGKSQDGKEQPAMKNIWEFENDLRKDTRWLKTDNARDSVMSATRQVLKDFGLQQ